MSGRFLLPAKNGDRAPDDTQIHDQKPQHSRNTKPRRVQVDCACKGCRRRKHRCDGIRPRCSHCQMLKEDCEYTAEKGETRWSALRRKNRILERDCNDALELLALVQSQSEAGGQEIFRRIRGHHSQDFGALVQQIRNDMNAGILLHQQVSSERRGQHEYLNQHQQLRQAGAAQQTTLEPLTEDQAPGLPPLRSMIDMRQGTQDTVVSEMSFAPQAGRG